MQKPIENSQNLDSWVSSPRGLSLRRRTPACLKLPLAEPSYRYRKCACINTLFFYFAQLNSLYCGCNFEYAKLKSNILVKHLPRYIIILNNMHIIQEINNHLVIIYILSLFKYNFKLGILEI